MQPYMSICQSPSEPARGGKHTKDTGAYDIPFPCVGLFSKAVIFEERIHTWNPKQPFINGCFNWMIPNLYIESGCFTKHPFINGCLGFQVAIQMMFLHCTKRREFSASFSALIGPPRGCGTRRTFSCLLLCRPKPKQPSWHWRFSLKAEPRIEDTQGHVTRRPPFPECM